MKHEDLGKKRKDKIIYITNSKTIEEKTLLGVKMTHAVILVLILIDIFTDKIEKRTFDQKSGIDEIHIMLSKKEKRVYFGMTKCKFSEKIKEHQRDFK